jgi:hypothetical protein
MDIKSHRFINVEAKGNWALDTVEEFNREMEPLGIRLTEVVTDTDPLEFSCVVDLQTFLSLNFLPDDFVTLRTAARRYREHSGYKARIYVATGERGEEEPAFEVRPRYMPFEAHEKDDPMLPLLTELVKEDIRVLHPQAMEIVQAYAGQLVDAVRKHYEYLISDEAVAATLNKERT